MAPLRLVFPLGGALLLAPLLIGCGAARATDPESTLEHFGSALRLRDYTEAYELLSEAYRAKVPYDQFVRTARDNPEEVAALVALIDAPHEAPEITAELPYGDGESLHLLFEDGAWRIVGDAVDFYDQSTPRAALRSFVRAMERKRYDVVLRFVPRADMEGMSEERMREAWEGEDHEEVERLLANLRASLENPIEEIGDRATMPYGQRFTVQFVREDGVWKIEDPD